MTRRALPSVPRSLSQLSKDSPRHAAARFKGEPPKGEPIVTAIWTTVSAATLFLGLSLACLSAVDSPLTTYIVPTVAMLYAVAVAATCSYNRIRYGRVLLKPLPSVAARRSHRRATATRRGKRPLAVVIG